MRTTTPPQTSTVQVPATHLDWSMEGFEDQDEVALWANYFTPKWARIWCDEGFDAYEARVWAVAFTPNEAARWRKVGFYGAQARDWAFGPDHPTRLRRGDAWEPHFAARLRRDEAASRRKGPFRFTPNAAHEWSQAGFRWHEALAWRSVGTHHFDAQDWRDSGWSPAEAEPWLTQHFSATAASNWSREGFSTQAAVEWRTADYHSFDASFYVTAGFATPVDLFNEWIACGFNQHSAPEWEGACIVPRTARRWARPQTGYPHGLRPTETESFLASDIHCPRVSAAWLRAGAYPPGHPLHMWHETDPRLMPGSPVTWDTAVPYARAGITPTELETMRAAHPDGTTLVESIRFLSALRAASELCCTGCDEPSDR